MEEDKKFELLKKINTKMGWALFFLICITLNTCSVADDIGDLAGIGEKAASVEKG